ncbi:MAG TPA: trypsin-like peptidase domain-containing protein [Polyangia bacterium]|jgi:S1-C subfamily serine protease
MSRLPRLAVVFAGVAGVAVVAGVAWANLGGPRRGPAAAATAVAFPAPIGARAPLARGGVRDGFARIIAAVRPAVVSIARPAQGNHVSPTSGTRFVDPYLQGNTRVGAGVIIDPRGYVLTTQQVVGGERELWVTTQQQAVLRAHRVAEDRDSDLVLLRVVTSVPLPAAPLGDSDRLEIGNLVLAFGCPYGFAESVTSGIVSSNHRRLAIEGRVFDDLIQTDARLNPGSSGGPLVNINGEVVGISVGTLSMNSTFVGIGFAIASNRARVLLTQGAR